MIGEPYSVEIKSLADSTCDVVFAVEPPIEFATEEAREVFGNNVLQLVARRAGQEALEGAVCEVTHVAEGQSMGYAKIETLRYGSGKEIFTQALLLALNGSYPDLYIDGVAPWERE